MSVFFSVPAGGWAGEACVVLGGGPSLKGFDCARLRRRARVIAVNNAGLDLAPWADVLFWADRRWLDWNHQRLGEHTGPLKITRKPPQIDTGHDIKVMRFLPRRLSHERDALGGWCGGSSAINLAYLMGARVIILMGFDMRPGNYHADHRLPPIEGQHRERFIPTLEAMEPELTARGVTVLNATPRSALRCFPFAHIEELLMLDDLAQAEREKYVAIWQRPEYRRISPGMLETDRAWRVCDMKAGQSLIDFGAGPARATKWFEDHGLDVVAVDFAPNARERDVPFIEACLWDLPEALPAADHAYCCDVMEHIPTAHVGDVLAGIAARTKRAAYFRIATRPDRMGRLIGVKLHLTVEGGEWWRRRVEAHFPLVDVVENSGRDIVLLARP